MNTITKLISSCFISMTVACFGQNFINLGFESANVTPLPPGQFEIVTPANAFPGWQAYEGTNTAVQCVHNSISLGRVETSILGPTYSHVQPNGSSFILEGNYTAVLNSGLDPTLSRSIPASLAQVGLVPSMARSLQFKTARTGSSVIDPMVFLNGQSLSLIPLQMTPAYTLFGADITPYAGQMEELRFTAPGIDLGVVHYVYLDAIEFSTQVVPEPGTWVLLALGSAALWCASRRRRK